MSNRSKVLLPEDQAKVTAILRRARIYLMHGWCQHYAAAVITGGPWHGGSVALRQVGTLDPAATHYCIIGAVERAAADMGETYWADFALGRIQDSFKHLFSAIAGYNDRKGRRQETILRRIDKAIGGK